jgi:hypothetical protein
MNYFNSLSLNLSLDFKMPNVKNNFKGDNIPTFTIDKICAFYTKNSRNAFPPRKVGWLFKEGHGFISFRQRRWCVLDGGNLVYFEQESSLPPYGIKEKGTVSLKGVTLTTAETSTKIPKLRIHLSVGLPGTKDLLLETSDEINFQLWLTDIQTHIDAYHTAI